MPGWALLNTHPTQGRTFQRPLDATELCFLWHGLCDGTTDSLQHLELRLLNGSRDAHLFSEANVTRAWLSTKRRYPLAGAIVQDASGPLRPGEERDSKVKSGDDEYRGDDSTGFASEPHFVVQEHDLAVLRPCEIIFGHVACAEEAQQQVAAIMDGPRTLSEELLAQLYVFRETDSKRTDVLHLMTLMAHCITDGVAINTFARCLLDMLARGEGSDLEPAQLPLEERLGMAIPSMELEPAHLRLLSPARRRWRRAVGVVIFWLRMAKRQGGHTLPCHFKRSTLYVAARSGRISTRLTHAQSAAVISNCRLHNITFGNAYLPLAQVAMARVLCRRYLRGEIPDEEWAYRKRQPYLSGSLLNLRPYLDKAWFERGGGGEFVLSIGFPFYQLPFMTLGAMAKQHQPHLGEHDPGRVLLDGAPPFSELLTFDRFLHRTGLIKKQAAAFVSHPLLLEVIRAANLAYAEQIRPGAPQWMQRVKAANGSDTQGSSDGLDDVVAVTDTPMVLAHGGSSFGNADLILPSKYPLPPTHPLSPYSPVPHPVKTGYVTPPSPSLSASEVDTTPTIAVEHTDVHLHSRPTELYLGAASLHGELNMYAFYDGNVYEEGVVREWLDEVRDAVLWYLGRAHRSQRTREGRGGGDGGGLDRGVRAKL